MPITSNLAKKTKNEILDEYNKLLNQMEDAKTTAQSAFLPDNAAILSRASTYSLEPARETMSKIKTDVANKFNELSLKLGDALGFMDGKLVEELKKLEEIQKAIEIAKNILESHHHLQIAANALEILVEEYKDKKQQLETEYQNIKKTSDEEISRQKLTWSREQV